MDEIPRGPTGYAGGITTEEQTLDSAAQQPTVDQYLDLPGYLIGRKLAQFAIVIVVSTRPQQRAIS